MEYTINFFIGKTFILRGDDPSCHHTALSGPKPDTIVFRHDWNGEVENDYWELEYLIREYEDKWFIPVQTEVNSYPIC